jgi:hypothetical protein
MSEETIEYVLYTGDRDADEWDFRASANTIEEILRYVAQTSPVEDIMMEKHIITPTSPAQLRLELAGWLEE